MSKKKFYMILLIWGTYRNKIQRDRRQNGELLFTRYRVSVLEGEKVLKMDSGDVVITL